MIKKSKTGNNVLLVLVFCVLSLSSIGEAQESVAAKGARNERQMTSEAVEYHGQLTVLFPELRQSYYDYTKAAIKSRRIRSIEKSRQELLKVIQKNQVHIQTSPIFHNDTTLRSELIRYLELLYIVMKEDFGKILDMEDIAAQSYDEDEAHQLALDMAFDKLYACRDVLKNAEDSFFKRYNITVNETKDKLETKIEQANNAINYYNPIYRIFYKANKQSSYTHIALEKKDLATLQQHTNTLLAFAEEGLQKLKQQKDFNGDGQLLKVAEEILQFYKSEGSVSMPENIRFFLVTEDFTNARKKLESIKPEARTQKDIDEYNKTVNTYNASIKKINQINDSVFKKHRDLIEKWKKTVEKFFEAHTS